MGRLRTYAPMPRTIKSLRAEISGPVDARSGDRCEVVIDGSRCRARVWDFHHTVKPRESNNTPEKVIAICRNHHDRVDWPYKRGRLQILPVGDGTFSCAIVTSPDKFTYRQAQP